MSLDPQFWNDPEHAEKTLKDIKDHKKWVCTYERLEQLADDAEILLDFFREGEASEEDVDAI